MNESWRTRITIEPGKRGGRPCIRGMRITVYDVLSYLAAGMTVAEILDDFPYLTQEDIQACFAFAAGGGTGRAPKTAAGESEACRSRHADQTPSDISPSSRSCE